MTNPHGAIDQSEFGRKNDYLYRVSVKGLVLDDAGKVLVVKEAGRDWWDLPGGGMDHDESIKSALARELAEEVNLQGEFTYRIIHADEPHYLPSANVWQVRLIFHVIPENMDFSVGVDADEFAFMNPEVFAASEIDTERRIYDYYSSTL